MQETNEFFRDMTDIARANPSDRQTDLMKLFVEFGVVELMRDFWEQCENERLMALTSDLPRHVDTLLTV